MSGFIKLTETDTNEPIFVNSDRIVIIRRERDGKATFVQLADAPALRVNETPQNFGSLLRRSKRDGYAED